MVEIAFNKDQIAFMKRNLEMYKERHELLKTFIDLEMPPSISLKLIEPMETMPEAEKEVFAKDLRIRLENREIDFVFISSSFAHNITILL